MRFLIVLAFAASIALRAAIPTANLIGDYRATHVTESGNLISAWLDQSGNGNNATQSTNASKPILSTDINGLPIITFPYGGSDPTITSRWVTVTSGAFASLSLRTTTIYFVGNFHLNANAQMPIMSVRNSFMLAGGELSGAPQRLKFGSLSSTNYLPINPSVMAVGGRGASETAFLLNTNIQSIATGQSATAVTGGVDFGRGNSTPLIGTMYRLLVYSASHDNATMLSISDELAQTYNILTNPVGQIVIRGDSITAGYKNSDDNNWPTYLRGELSDWRIYNYGVIGQSFIGLIGAAVKDNVLIDPIYNAALGTNILDIFLGVNDISSGSSAGTTFTNLHSYTNLYTNSWTKVVSTVLDRGGAFDTAISDFNALERSGTGWMVKDWGKNSVWWSDFNESSGNPYYNADQLHLSDLGEERLATFAFNYMSTNFPGPGSDPVPDYVKFDWTRNINIGVAGGVATNSGTIWNMRTLGADPNGVTNMSLLLSNVYYTMAAPGDTILFDHPSGQTQSVYRNTNNLSFTRSGIDIVGIDPNVWIFHTGPSAFPIWSFTPAVSTVQSDSNVSWNVFGIPQQGSTNLTLASSNNIGGTTSIFANGMYTLTEATREFNNDDWPRLDIFNNDRLIAFTVVVHSVSNGTNVNLMRPIPWNMTNQPILYANSGAGQGVLSNVVIANLTFTTTNDFTGESGSPAADIGLQWIGAYNCAITNCTFRYIDDYSIKLIRFSGGDLSHNNLIGRNAGTGSKAGIQATDTTYTLIEDNAISGIYPAIELNNAGACVVFLNFGTNNTAQDFMFHTTHDMKNLIEHNWFETGFIFDGNTGSKSHNLVFRNAVTTGGGQSGIQVKRFNTYNAFVGNIVGSTNHNFTYYSESGGNPLMSFEFGRPSIGNLGFFDTVPPRSRNFPGTNFVHVTANTNFLNGWLFTTTQGPTNVLTNDFSRIAGLTPSNGYGIRVQSASDTNEYYSRWEVMPKPNGLQFSAVTATNMTLGTNLFTIQGGDTLYIGGQTAYQMLDTELIDKNVVTGNGVYTNLTYGVVWASGITGTNLISTYFSRPTWMSAVAYPNWPMIGPDVSGLHISIPARDRFFSQSVTPVGAALISGEVHMSGAVLIQ